MWTRNLTGREVLLLILGLIVSSALVIPMIIGPPPNQIPAVHDSKLDNLNLENSVGTTKATCHLDKLANIANNKCCQNSFETGLFDKEVFMLCMITPTFEMDCSPDEMKRSNEKIRCVNNKKGGLYNPCNEKSGDAKTACNQRREFLIKNIAAKTK